MKSVIMGIGFLAFLTGCSVPVAPDSTYVRATFDDAEYGRLAKTGTGIVKGQAFLKTRGGDVKKGAGEMASLHPITTYSERDYIFGHIGMKTPNGVIDPRVREHIRTTKADADGKFEFANVPPGKYYVYSLVTWSAPSRYGLLPQGGPVAEKVTVENGKTVEAMLTR